MFTGGDIELECVEGRTLNRNVYMEGALNRIVH